MKDEILRYYNIDDYQRQIVRYQDTFAEQIAPKVPSPELIEDWRKNGIYFGHHRTGLGEILSYTALPRYLKKKYPEFKIYFCGHRFGEAIFRNNPDVDGVGDIQGRLPYGSQREFGFGTTTQKRLRSFGIFTVDPSGPEMTVSQDILDKWLEWKSKLPLAGRKLVLVQSSGRTNAKVLGFWNWLRLLRSLRDEFYFVQVGNLRDQFIWANESKLKQWDMEDLAGILKVGDAFVGPNSGVMHLASAVGVNAVIFHNEAKASEMVLPLLADNWLLPHQANHHLFHVYPWHYHLVVDKLWDVAGDVSEANGAMRMTLSNLRSSLQRACKGPQTFAT